MVFSINVSEKLDISKEQYEAATQTLMDNRQTTKSINPKASRIEVLNQGLMAPGDIRHN